MQLFFFYSEPRYTRNISNTILTVSCSDIVRFELAIVIVTIMINKIAITFSFFFFEEEINRMTLYRFELALPLPKNPISFSVLLSNNKEITKVNTIRTCEDLRDF